MVSHQTACLRPMPADGKPYVGLAPGWENVYIASGHWSEGVHYGSVDGEVDSGVDYGRGDVDGYFGD